MEGKKLENSFSELSLKSNMEIEEIWGITLHEQSPEGLHGITGDATRELNIENKRPQNRCGTKGKAAVKASTLTAGQGCLHSAPGLC